jgi:type VI secretion system protein ImpA
VGGLYTDRKPVESATPTPDAEVAPESGAVGSPTASGPVRSRKEAFARLNEVAAFFEQMDPQCLLAAHIRRIVRLGNMSVAEYFSEIVEDKNAREQLFKLVGLSPPKEG